MGTGGTLYQAGRELNPPLRGKKSGDSQAIPGGQAESRQPLSQEKEKLSSVKDEATVFFSQLELSVPYDEKTREDLVVGRKV